MTITYDEAKKDKHLRYALARAWRSVRALEQYHRGVPGGWLRWYVTTAGYGEMVYDNQARYWRWYRHGAYKIELPITPGQGACYHEGRICQ